MTDHQEYKIHIAIVKHHLTAFPEVRLMYVPNAVRDATDAYFNKMMGVQPGAHDLFLFWRKCIFNHIRWIGVGIFEVKSKTGKLSTVQNKFASGLASLGAHTGYGSSVKAYHETLKSWGLKPVHNSILEPDLRTDQEKKLDSFYMYMPRKDV